VREIDLDISGLGLILYSPSAVNHISEGSNYLQEHFWQAVDIARHVMDCQLTAVCTGTPGSFELRFFDGPPNARAVEAADFKVRLGLQVHDGVICIRDLYDLMRWSADCPIEQQLSVNDGWYRLTLFTSCPPSGIFGNDQTIDIHLEPVSEKPNLRWKGIPYLCE
jgi:hypothetical protein